VEGAVAEPEGTSPLRWGGLLAGCAAWRLHRYPQSHGPNRTGRWALPGLGEPEGGKGKRRRHRRGINEVLCDFPDNVKSVWTKYHKHAKCIIISSHVSLNLPPIWLDVSI